MKALDLASCMVLVFWGIQSLSECRLLLPNYYDERRPYIKMQSSRLPITDQDDPGDPLFLTPFIETGQIKKARKMSRVRPNIGQMKSYSGFLTVNKTCGSNLFFWYFQAQNRKATAPLLVWLQGGPGSTSMYGLFEEMGPFNSFPEGIQTRNYSWNVENNLVFFDQPVGTGYSFTEQGCYVTNQTEVGKHMYNAIIQFLTLFPDLQKNNFFLTGESFAGHYIPAIAHTIHMNNPTAQLKINLKGMMIGDGWIDPREQIDYAEYLYQTCLIDGIVRNQMKGYQDTFVKQVDNQQWNFAEQTWHAILKLIKSSANVSLYNYLPQPQDHSNWDLYIQTVSTRKAIHVGSLSFDKFSKEVFDHLSDNMPTSVKSLVEQLLEVYPMVFYGGQLDIICGYPMMITFLQSLTWSGQSLYLNATRVQWWEGDDLAGYIRGQHHLYDVLVRDAGHMVPANQPHWAFKLVNAFASSNITSLITSQMHNNEMSP